MRRVKHAKTALATPSVAYTDWNDWLVDETGAVIDLDSLDAVTATSLTLTTDLAVLDGGTGASDAAGARTNLGLVIGANVQAWDSDLDTWAGKTAPTGTVVGTSDSQTLTAKTLTSPAIGDIAPVANFTLTQNAVVPFTSVFASAVVNTLYLSAGKVGIGTATPGNKLTVTLPTTADVLADAMIGTTATTQKGLVIQGKASQTANLQEWQRSTGGVLAQIDPGGKFVSNPAINNLGGLDLTFYANTLGTSAAHTTARLVSNVRSVSGLWTEFYTPATINITQTLANAPACIFAQAQMFAGAGLTVAEVQGFKAYMVKYSAGTVTTSKAISIETPLVVDGTLANSYGLYINNQSGASTLNCAILTNAGNIVFNEGGDATTDFRVEGDTDANLLFTDASADAVGIGTATPTTSAKLDISSTAGALLIPRMTTDQKTALTPTNGMIVYDATLNKFQGYENGAWTSFI